MAVLFISDLHLSASRPHISRTFTSFLDGAARHADALYVLGDLFDYWPGDEDIYEPFNAGIVRALSACARHTPLYLMHGNRDFLIGERFAAAAAAQLIDDPALIQIEGAPTLLTHGDMLCTDDEDYMRFRTKVRTREWIDTVLATPLAQRKRQLEELRHESEAQKKLKTAQIMDVNATAVESLLRAHGYPRLIHGHVHRPAMHVHRFDSHRCERWVLGDWLDSGSYLSCAASRTVQIALAK